MSRKSVAEIIPLRNNLTKGFHYYIPPEMEDIAYIGKRVKIPFRNKQIVGVITKKIYQTNITSLKNIEEVIDPIPVITESILDLADWISRYYICPIGTVVNYIVPTKISRKKILAFLQNGVDNQSQPGVDINMVNNGISTLEEKENQFPLPENSELQYNDAPDKPFLFHYNNHNLRDRFYRKCINRVLQRKRQVFIMVPDQWCCAELKKKLANRYGAKLGIFDKKVSQTEKYIRFLKAKRGDVDVVIGTRSNIFLPFKDLGLIIVEQENSLLYKEERMPRYNAKHVALSRGKLEKIEVILSSHTPSVDSYWCAENNKYILKTEKQMIHSQKIFPEIKLVDLKEEKAYQRIISFELQQNISQCLKKGEKVILFLNRRGFAGHMVCSQCGHVIKCPECNHILAYHITGEIKSVLCHMCGKRVRMEEYCPKCGKGRIKPVGAGTQHVEALTKRMFPKATVSRLDIDNAPGAIEQKKIINEFNRGKIDILIGTQIIFRQVKYDNVGLLGLILADYLLNIPDYRSAELTFQFIYNLALQYSTRKDAKKILIQSYQPEHYSLQAIEKINYRLFYQQELLIRKELDYPPFTQMIKIDFLGKKRENVKKNADELIQYFNHLDLINKYELGFQLDKDNIVITREKYNSKVSFIMRINTEKNDLDFFKDSLSKYISKYRSHDVKLIIDVNPMKMY